MMRIGAPLAKAPSTPSVPADTPMSELPEITACWVSAPARRVETLQLEAVAREDAGLGADFGNRAVPQAALADGELEHLGRVCLRTDKNGGERAEQNVARMEPRAARRNPGSRIPLRS